MFRAMRRHKQEMSAERSEAVMKKCTAGTLAVHGDDDYPYSVPVSYCYEEGKIYFHCAAEGHKLDSIRRNEKVSFSVIETNDIVQEEYTTYFRSVIAFGRAHVIDDPEEKRASLEKLALKYSPDYEDGISSEIDKSFDNVRMVRIDVEHMTGKEAIELVK